MAHYDAIVLGAGGVGSAALYHLARRGLRVLGLDRFEPGHSRGSSHGQTRLIRQAYFEHPDYVPLLVRAFELWKELEAEVGRQLYYQVGLLEVGRPEGEVLRGVRASAALHGLPIENLTCDEAQRRFPGFRIPPDCEAVFETRAGYLLVEPCVVAHAQQAVRHGAELHGGETVLGWQADGGNVVVRTERGEYRAARLVIAAGAWSGPLLAALRIPLEVRRKPLFWFRTAGDSYRANRGCPAFYYELDWGHFYGVPQIDEAGIKVAEHTGGQVVADPLQVDRGIHAEDQARVERFNAQWLPQVISERTDHTVCMYTMTPDAHFVVDRHPEHPQVAFAAGLSGHGFKFTGVLGEALAQLALSEPPRVPLDFLSLRRQALAAP